MLSGSTIMVDQFGSPGLMAADIRYQTSLAAFSARLCGLMC